jgi:hypothetical protein
MKIKLTTWQSMLARYGDYEARRHLRCLRKALPQPTRGLFRVERDPFSLIHDLRRERTNALCAPGISLQRLL